MSKIVMEIELKGTALLEASETLLKMAQAIDARLVPAPPAPEALAPAPPAPEASAPEASAPEVSAPEASAPEASAPEASAPEASAPKASAPEASAPTVDGSELDSEGIPWDGRIHSTGKSKVQSNGTWKLKRRVDKALVAKVKAEYLAASPPVPPVAPPVPPVAPPVPPVAPKVEDQTPSGYKMTEAADGIPYESYIEEGWEKEQLIEMGIMVAVESTPDAAITYESIIDKVTLKINSGDLKPGELETILASLGDPSVNSLPSLAKRPELWASVYGKLVEAWG